MTDSNYQLFSEIPSAQKPASPVRQAIARRISKRAQIEQFFLGRIGESISSADLHAKFGSAVRTRISELNRSQTCSLTISNSISILPGGAEESIYIAAVRA